MLTLSDGGQVTALLQYYFAMVSIVSCWVRMWGYECWNHLFLTILCHLSWQCGSSCCCLSPDMQPNANSRFTEDPIRKDG